MFTCAMYMYMYVQYHTEHTHVYIYIYIYICIALIFRGSKFSQFSQIRCHSQKYFNEYFDILHHCLLLQRIREIFSMKLSKTAIRKHFDLRNISAIQ